MADHDPLRSPPPPPHPAQQTGQPLSPRVIQFVDDLLDIPTSRDQSPSKASRSDHRSKPVDSHSLNRSSPDPLSRARSPGVSDPMTRDYGAVAREPSSNSTGATVADGHDTPVRQGYRAAGPGSIHLPPSPYTPRPVGDDANLTSGQLRPRTGSVASPSVATSGGQRGASNRKMSFKRRAPSMQQRQGLLQRASMGIFPQRKPSMAASDAGSNWKSMRRVHTASVHPAGDGDDGIDIDALIAGEAPSIPRMLPTSKADPYSTPIPTLPFIVLCLVCFGEFSSAGVAGPFLFFLIEDFGVGGESDVGFWAGIVSASFFFAQFLTSLMWASVADKRGRRFVLLVSLLGNAVTMMLFGTSKNLATAILIRLAQGFFNGAVGVAKGAIRDITDETNEGRAYAQLGFMWGMGGICGPILGGVLEHPAQKYPGLFGESQLFIDYPYLLPCLVAAAFTGLGAFLSLFIGYDGGPRTGAIHLPEKADVERAANQMGSFGRSAGQRISGYFSGAHSATQSDVSLPRKFTTQGEGTSTPEGGAATSKPAFPRTFTQQVDYETGGPPSPAESQATIITHGHTNANDSAFSRGADFSRRQRLFSRTEERQRGILGGGSAYGYERHMSKSSAAPATQDRNRLESFHSNRGGRGSFSSTTQYAPDFEEIGQRPGLSFAQRFLLAQDDSVFTISDLWVAAAINGEETYEDVFEDDEEDMDNEPFEDDSVVDDSVVDNSIDEMDEEDDEGALHEGSSLLTPRHLPPINFAQRKMSRAGLSDAGRSHASSRPRSMRRPSASGRIPSLYANVGVETPLLSPGVNPLSPYSDNMQGPLGASAGGGAQTRTEGAWDPTLAGIPESHSSRNSLMVPSSSRRQVLGSPSPDRRSVALSATGAATAGSAALVPPAASLFTLLPAAIIAHYGLLAFHSSTFDQVFMAFLVTPEPSGGLGLTASHYAQLIAAMAFCQLIFQFVFYPKVGPPQGKLSHLAMLRLGTAIYLPCYTLFPLLRGMLHPETDGFVMTGMIFFASLRWLANICAFTAVSVLINALTPPHLTPLANGLAQTTSSAARFVGPIIGGIVWAKGIQGGPVAHPWPLNYHLGFWFVGIAAFIGFLFTWRIK